MQWCYICIQLIFKCKPIHDRKQTLFSFSSRWKPCQWPSRNLPSSQTFLWKLAGLFRKRAVLTLLVKSAKMSKAGDKREKMGSICQDLRSRILEQHLQPFWHQEPVLWTSIFPQTRGWGETVSGWFKHITFRVHFISVIITLWYIIEIIIQLTITCHSLIGFWHESASNWLIMVSVQSNLSC